MAASDLWVEKYRPKTVNDYVFKDANLKDQVKHWIADKSIPQLMITGPAGTGKSSLAGVLINELGVLPTDILVSNASKDARRIDWLNDKLVGFCETMPFGEFKVVLLEEFDYSNANSVQPALRNLSEEYSQFVRFILTANYPHRIIPAIHSRFQHIRIEKHDKTEFTARMATILIEENVAFDLDTLDAHVNATYPDMRKCINNLQLSSLDGKLLLTNGNDSTLDYKEKMVELFEQDKILEARKLLCENARPEEMEEIYTWLYKNLQLFGDNESTQFKALQIIKRGLVDHVVCSDAEINLSATLVALFENKNK